MFCLRLQIKEEDFVFENKIQANIYPYVYKNENKINVDTLALNLVPVKFSRVFKWNSARGRVRSQFQRYVILLLT